MYEIGDCIVCGKHGTCKVVSIGPMAISGASDRLYYTLSPVYSSGSTVFVPVDNVKVVMRPVLTKEEANALIDSLAEVKELVVDVEKQREFIYKNAINSCDCDQLLQLLKALMIRRKERLDSGKKVPSIDERYSKIAQDYLYGELALALEMEKRDVATVIENGLE